jgi:hypothetical protein
VTVLFLRPARSAPTPTTKATSTPVAV